MPSFNLLADADFVVVVMVAGIVGSVVLAFVIGSRMEKKRREAMRALAEAWGFHFNEKMEGLAEAEFAGLRLFTLGRSKVGSNLIYRHEDHGSELLFDYRYTTGGGKNSQTHRQTVVAMTFTGALPAFELRPEHVFHKIGGMLGMQDIKIPDRPAFSGKFLLREADEEAIRGVFTGPVCDLLERNPKLSVEARDHYLIVYRAARRPKPDELAGYLELARQIRDTLLAGRSAGPAGARIAAHYR